MRFVKLKTTVSKVVDEHVDDIKTIKSMIELIKSQEITCSIRLADGPKYQGCRIDKVSDEEFGFRIINTRSTLRKKASLTDIEYLEINTSSDVLSRSKPNVSRFSLLDPESDFDEQ